MGELPPCTMRSIIDKHAVTCAGGSRKPMTFTMLSITPLSTRSPWISGKIETIIEDGDNDLHDRLGNQLFCIAFVGKCVISVVRAHSATCLPLSGYTSGCAFLSLGRDSVWAPTVDNVGPIYDMIHQLTTDLAAAQLKGEMRAEQRSRAAITLRQELRAYLQHGVQAFSLQPFDVRFSGEFGQVLLQGKRARSTKAETCNGC